MSNEEISKLLREIKRKIGKASSIKKVNVSSAHEIDLETKKKISEQFSDQGEVNFDINSELIGGIRIKIGNKVNDDSIKSQHNKLHDNIQEKISEIIAK